MRAQAGGRAIARPTPAHAIKYKVTDGRLICSTCKRPVVGARTGFTGRWQGGQHA